jgi:hypothetical protein
MRKKVWELAQGPEQVQAWELAWDFRRKRRAALTSGRELGRERVQA